MGEPTIGVVIRQVDEEARPVIAADLSTIGIIGPSSDADAVMYPYNDPVLVNSNEISKTSKLGTDGYLADAIRGINDQLADTQFAARCVIVRTPRSVNANSALALQENIANIMGDSTLGTGMWAFLKAVSKLTVTPRIIIAPGFTSQMANGVNVVTRGGGGAGYVQGQSYPITFSGGGSGAVQATGHAFGNTDGTLGSVVLDTPGAWYTTPPTVTAPSAGKRVTAATIASGGTGGYIAGEIITLANDVEITVDTVDGSGIITGVHVSDPGRIGATATNPTNPQAQVSSTGSGVGASFNLTWAAYTAATYTATIALGANPVVTGSGGVLDSLIAHEIAESAGTSQINDDDWRETINHKRVVPISGGVRVLDPVSKEVVFRPLASRIAGIAVAVDHEKGAPFHSWANRPVQGIVGPMRDITFALTSDSNEAQELLRNNIGVVVRGELGNDFAIASGGFVFLGTDNAGEDELWRFYNMVRGRDFIHLTAIRAMRFYLGRFNVTLRTVQAMLNAMKGILRDLKADSHIIGYKMAFNPASNSADEVRLGHIAIGFAAEEPAPVRLIRIESARYRQAVDAEIATLATQLNLVA